MHVTRYVRAAAVLFAVAAAALPLLTVGAAQAGSSPVGNRPVLTTAARSGVRSVVRPAPRPTASAAPTSPPRPTSSPTAVSPAPSATADQTPVPDPTSTPSPTATPDPELSASATPTPSESDAAPEEGPVQTDVGTGQGQPGSRSGRLANAPWYPAADPARPLILTGLSCLAIAVIGMVIVTRRRRRW